jgi:hypothetical protein
MIDLRVFKKVIWELFVTFFGKMIDLRVFLGFLSNFGVICNFLFAK